MLNDSKNIVGIYDTGATVTVINHKVLQTIQHNLIRKKQTLSTVSGTKMINFKTIISIKIGKVQKDVEVIVYDDKNFSFDLILGLDVIKTFKLCQDENLNIFQLDEETNRIHRINETKNEESKNICNTISSSCLSKFLDHLSFENRIQLEKNLLNFANVFTNDKFDTGTVKTMRRR